MSMFATIPTIAFGQNPAPAPAAPDQAPATPAAPVVPPARQAADQSDPAPAASPTAAPAPAVDEEAVKKEGLALREIYTGLEKSTREAGLKKILTGDSKKQQQEDLKKIKEAQETLDRASALFTKEEADPEKSQSNKAECKELLDGLMGKLANSEKAMRNPEILKVLEKYGINPADYKGKEPTSKAPQTKQSAGF